MPLLTRGERFKDARTVYNQHGNQTMSTVQSSTGVSASLIADLENDDKDRKANYIDVATLAKHYGVTTDWLCGLSEDHHTTPCASSDLRLSESSIYFLKSLNEIWSAYDTMIHPARQTSPDDAQTAAQAWNEAMSRMKCFNNLHDYPLRAYATLCAEYGPQLIDILISAVEENYKMIVDFSDLHKASLEGWDIKNEHLSFDDYVRFKSSEIAKVIDRFLVSKFEKDCAYYDRVTDEIGYLYKFHD